METTQRKVDKSVQTCNKILDINSDRERGLTTPQEAVRLMDEALGPSILSLASDEAKENQSSH